MTDDDIQLSEAGEDTTRIEGELSLDDLGGSFIKNPPVGESVEFVIKSIAMNKKNLSPINPKTGKKMTLALSSVDYNVHVHSMDGKIYECSSWAVWGKIKAIWRKLANGNKSFIMTNQTIRISHLLDGMRPENKSKECYSVAVLRDGKFYTLGQKSNEWEEAA